MGGDPLIAGARPVSPAAAALLRWAALAIAVVLALVLGLRAAAPPRPLGPNAPATAFSAARAMVDVRAIAVRPHPTGSPDNARVRAYLVARLQQLGLAVDQRHYLIDGKSAAVLARWSGGRDQPAELTDVVGVLRGRDPTLPAVMLMAHYDTVWGSPGAPDDSAGVASILETVRAIEARGRPQRDVMVLFTDGEEIGLSGARAFWSGDGWPSHVGVVLNLESRGGGGRTTMFETGARNGAMMALFAKAVRHPVANSMTVLAYRHMPNDTDYTPVRERGVPGFNFAMLGRAALYHSPLATPDRLDPATVQDMGDQALDLASALADAKTLPPRSADATFFDLGGSRLVHYASGAGWWIVLGALAAWVLAWKAARRAGEVSVGGVIAGLFAALWLLAIGALLVGVLDLLSIGHAHPENYYDRLAELPRLEAQAVLAALAALLFYCAWRRPGPRLLALVLPLVLALFGLWKGGPSWLVDVSFLAGLIGWFAPREGTSRWGGRLGILALLVVAAAVAQAKVPLAAWIVAWPALLIGGAAAVAAWLDPRFERGAGPLVAAFAAIVVVAPLLPLAHLAFLAIGGTMPLAMIALLPIPAAAFWPLARVTAARRVVLLVACACLVAAGAIAIRVRTAPLSPSVPAYSLTAPAR